MAKECPVCRLLNPDIAERCDCGYDFATRRVAASYANPNDREINAERGMTVAQVGLRTMKNSVPQLIGTVLALVYGIEALSRNPRATGAAFWALIGLGSAVHLLWRGIEQYRRGKRLERARGGPIEMR
jgi:hypothetical protein